MFMTISFTTATQLNISRNRQFDSLDVVFENKLFLETRNIHIAVKLTLFNRTQ